MRGEARYLTRIMLQIIVFVLAIECAVTDRQAKADDSNYSYSNKKVHGLPQNARNDFKAYLDTMKALYYDKKSKESGEVHFRKRLFKTIKKMFKKKEAKPSSTTSTTTSAPLNEGLFKRVTTTTSTGFIKKEEANWLNSFDEHGNNTSGKEPYLESEVPDIFNNKDATGDEVLMNLYAKSGEISFKNTTNKETLRTPYANMLTEHSDQDYVKATRYKRQVDKIDNIPVEVKPLSVVNKSTENKQNATKTKPSIKIKRHITNTKSKKEKPIEMRIKIKKENEQSKKVSVNLPNIDIHNFTLGEVLLEIKKGYSGYVDNIAHVNANVSDGQVNDSKIFKIRVKRKVNETQLNVLGQTFSGEPNATSRAREASTRRSKISNVTKADVENTTSSNEDHIQETSKNCNESKPLNGRRSYNRDDDETASEVKHKLLQYMEETFTEIFSKIQPLEELKRLFGTQDMYRMGYVVANIDTLDTNLRHLKTDLKSNKDLWSDRKIMDIFDKIMTTNKIVSNLLTALQAFTLHETSSVRPLVPFGPNYFPTQQPDRIY